MGIGKKRKMRFSFQGLSRRKLIQEGGMGIGSPSVYHALIVIFLEFFAWGLLTSPMLTLLNNTFPQQIFLMNGLIFGIKGFLSFLSAPLIGALSDVWGRKSFLLLSVFFTCCPIPLMALSAWWHFALVSMSGIFAVTFSVVFAYVADITDEANRSTAYGMISGTFAASLITSPAVGSYLENQFGLNLVVALASSIAILDVLFIMVAVPESLPEKVRPSSWGTAISWEKADPFAALRKIGHDHTVLILCVTVFLSYLPEAGQYSCIFLYLKRVIHFSSDQVASYIAVLGILCVVAQTVVLSLLMRSCGNKNTIIVGLVFETIQLMWYGLASEFWMMWAAGALAAMASITYPSISAMVSTSADAANQGVVQGMVTGFRGLCSGLGPALFGFIFYLFDVNLDGNDQGSELVVTMPPGVLKTTNNIFPGPPFAFGAILVMVALIVACFIPDDHRTIDAQKKKQDTGYEKLAMVEVDPHVASEDEINTL